MDGYTVDEAAEVLGIPGKRVWELITSGVLAASSEGRSGMRVFLQPRTTTEMESTGSGEPHGSEATPFRELLTEFRNLTDRYGQALLALGEARGEVASLRGRVDLLEARIDVRHAPPRIAPVGSWPIAPSIAHDADDAGLDDISGLAPPAETQEVGDDERSYEAVSPEAQQVGDGEPIAGGLVAEPIAEAEPEAVADPEPEAASVVDALPRDDALAEPPPEEHDGRSRRRRSKPGHTTTLADIPAALARAEDPTAAELRNATEEAAPVAAARDDVAQAARLDAEPETTLADGEGEPVPEAAPPLEAQGEAVSEEAAPLDAEPSEPADLEPPLFDLGSRYTTAFEDPDWIVEEDLWRSAAQPEAPETAETDDSAPSMPAPSEEPSEPSEPPGPEVDETSWAVAAEPEAAEPEAEAGALEPEPPTEPTETAEPAGFERSALEAEPSPETEPVDVPEPPAIEAITAGVAFSIAAPEPEEPESVATQSGEEAEEPPDEPPGDFDAFMAGADLGLPAGETDYPAEPDYAAELEHSAAGWHSVITPPEGLEDIQKPAESDEPDGPALEGAAPAPEGEPAAPAADEPDSSASDNWDASEMEAIRALLARANAIDLEELEVEASSQPLDPGQEESVREIVASGASVEPETPAAEPPEPQELPDRQEPIVDRAAPDAPTSDETPYSLSPHLELPGSNDLGEAMAALEAMSTEPDADRVGPDPTATARAAPLWPEAERRAWSGATPEPQSASPQTGAAAPSPSEPISGNPGEEVLAHFDFGATADDARQILQDRSEAHAATTLDQAGQGWLEPRDSAAGRAFRRLRRIFPG